MTSDALASLRRLGAPLLAPPLRPVLRRALLAVSTAALLATGACGGDDGDSGACAVSADCARLTACRDAACVAVQCVSAGQCNTDEVCATELGGARYCTATECGDGKTCPAGLTCSGGLCEQPCTTEADCAAGYACTSGTCSPTAAGSGGCSGDACMGRPCQTGADCDTLECISGQCLPAGGCLGDTDCPSGQRCESSTKTCVADSDAVGPGGPDGSDEGCVQTGCDAGEVCDPETGACGPAPVDGEGLCALCSGSGSCGGQDLHCTPLGGSQYCLRACQDSGDCPGGYNCLAGVASTPRCIPSGGTCDKPCIQNGCPSGTVCEFSSGECVTQLLLCDNCTKDELCGPGARCVQYKPNDRRCMPVCQSGSCPAGSACDDSGDVPVCKPGAASCCFGESCGGGPGNPCDSCPSDAPHCWQNACVQCFNSSQCPGGTCNTDSKTCVYDSGCDPPCGPSAPYCHPQTKVCVECLNSNQCADGELCANSNVCTGTDDICQFCVAPYPACAEIAGQMSCVQCTQDSDCSSGACDTSTFFCQGGNVPTTGDCKTDADCPTGTPFFLRCHTPSGLCYDEGGQCDNITAFCDASSGSTCTPLFDLLDIGSLIPGLAAGLCTCNTLYDLCTLFPNLCQGGQCFSGIECSTLGSIGGLLDPNLAGQSFCGGL